MRSNPLFDHISIILVEPKTPANIGAVARCMMNMGMSRLVLVDPPADSNNDAFKLAAGADTILKQARTVQTLEDAIAGQHIVIGTSRHAGRLRRNIRSPREMSEHIVSLVPRNKIAVVFGNEVNGLTNDHLALCHEIIAIPSSDDFPSLNLSHAVMVVAYELFIALKAGVPSASRQLASANDLHQFYRHLQTTLQTIGFLDRDRPDRMMFSLRQIFSRSQLDSREVSILRGILSVISRMCAKQP